jgi:hypothetical protein
MVRGLNLSAVDVQRAKEAGICEGCSVGKMHRHVADTLPSSQPRKLLKAGEMLHSDLMGPFPRDSNGAKYVATFIDEASRRSFIFLLRKKKDIAVAAKNIVSLFFTQTKRRLKYWQSDRGGEYLSSVLRDFFDQEGIIHRLSTTESPEQNGVAERFNRTLEESSLSTMSATGVSHYYWGECVKAANYVYNMMPHSARRVVPWKSFHGVKPDISILRAWGCRAVVCIPTQMRGAGKWQPKGEEGILVGYDVQPGVQSNGYRILLKTGKIVSSHHVVFDELCFPKRSKPSSGTVPKIVFGSPLQPGAGGAVQGGGGSSGGGDEASGGGDEQGGGDNEVFFTPEPTPAGEETEEGGPGGSELEEDVAGSEEGATIEQDSPSPPPQPRRSERSNKGQDSRVRFEQESFSATLSSFKGGPTFNRFSHRREDDTWVESRSEWKVLETLDQLISWSSKATAMEVKHSDTFGADAEQWREAEIKEIEGIRKLGVFTVVEEKPGMKILGAKMVYTLKADGRRKCRYVVKGYAQLPGVDFKETFSPQAHATVARVLLAKAAAEDREVYQGDISMAFLYATLEEDEELYVRGPNGEVWKLHKALYGLKQAPRQWYQTLKRTLATFGFQPSLVDPGLFTKKLADGQSIWFLVHVDDFLLSAPKGRVDLVEGVLDFLKSHFSLHDVGEPKVFCGLEIKRNREEGWLKVSQVNFTEELIQRWLPAGSSPRNIPAYQGIKLQREGGMALSEGKAVEYREIVGSLLWLATRTRPEISFIVGVLSRFFSAPTMEHMQVALDVLRYLKGCSSLGLIFHKDSNHLLGYSDADWAGDVESSKSVTGFCFLLHGAAVSWLAKLQACVATSSQHAEYMSAGSAAREGVWLRMVLEEFGFGSKEATQLFGDNHSALNLIHNPVISPKTKHINVAYHYTREQVEKGELKFDYVPTASMVADIFTKALGHVKFTEFRNRLGVL